VGFSTVRRENSQITVGGTSQAFFGCKSQINGIIDDMVTQKLQSSASCRSFLDLAQPLVRF
jgi:hypothetical protein